MLRKALLISIFALALGQAPEAHADPALKTSLQLTMAQAKQTDAIEKRFTQANAGIRGDFNRESRALRRARIANDEAEMRRLEGVTEALRKQMIDLRASTDAEIRAVLEPAQYPLFEAYLEKRRTLQGSGRDERTYGN